MPVYYTTQYFCIICINETRKLTLFFLQVPFSQWWDDKKQAWEAGKPHNKITGSHTMHSYSPRSTVLFRSMALDPWSLQQCGIDPAANKSINHSWQQQMCILHMESVFSCHWSGCGLLSIPLQCGGDAFCGMIYWIRNGKNQQRVLLMFLLLHFFILEEAQAAASGADKGSQRGVLKLRLIFELSDSKTCPSMFFFSVSNI